MSLLFLLLPLLFSSCNRKEPWQHTAIRNIDPKYDMAKLSYAADSPHKGIQLELIRQNQSIEGYLNVLTFEIPSLNGNPHQAQISFIVNGLSTSYAVNRLTGGQRLHLSKLALDTLIELFQRFPEVTIRMGHYSQTFSSTTFEKRYRQLCTLPPRLLPEKIVTFEFY